MDPRDAAGARIRRGTRRARVRLGRLASGLGAGTGGQWGRFLGWFERLGLSEDSILLLFGVAIGVAGALGVIAFFGLIDAAYFLLFRWAARGLPHPEFPFYRPLLTAAGLAGATWMVRRVERTPRGEAPESLQLIPSLQVAVARRGGEMPVRTALSRVAASAITLGSGGAAGSESPISVLGALAGSVLGRAFRFDPSRVRVLVGAGAAAGISAAFNAPLAGAFFALEEILGSFTAGAFPPVVIASVVAALISRSVFGDHPAIAIPAEYGYSSLGEVILLYPLLGVLAGLTAVVFIRTYFGIGDLRRRLEIPPGVLPWIGGSLVGVMVLASSGLLVGYGHLAIRLDLFVQLPWTTLALLTLGSIVATSLTLNAGGSGGVFAPSLFIGAALGCSLGVLLRDLLPGWEIHPEALALVGMGAVFAAATDAPMAAVLVVFEMTNDYAIVLPLMLAVVIAYRVARRIEPDTLYSGWLRRRGEHLAHGADRDLLATLRVADALDPDPRVVGEGATVSQLLQHLDRADQTDYPVVDAELRLVGIVTLADLGRLARDRQELTPLVLAADLATPTEAVHPHDSLLDAIRLMGVRGTSALPVVEPGSERLRGMVSRAGILALYERTAAGRAAARAG